MSVAPPVAPHVPGSIPCPRCASTVGPEQEWCLDCGAPARTRLVPTPNWRAPVAVLAVVVVLAGIALALAFISLTNDTEPAAPVNSQAPPPSATGGQPQSTPATTAPATPTANPGGGTTAAPTQGSPTGQSTGTSTGQTTGTGTGQTTTTTGTTTGQGTSTGHTTTGRGTTTTAPGGAG